ncbi:hypothetical protein RQP46_000195 [Phenoliferia psychrophenolica]
MYAQDRSPSPRSLPSPPIWHPHPALQILDHTLILLQAQRKRLSSADYCSLVQSVMAVHDFIASEDVAGALSMKTEFIGRRNASLDLSTCGGVDASGWHRGWGSGLVEEALTPSAEDKRGKSGWQDGWTWEAAKSDGQGSVADPDAASEGAEESDRDTIFGTPKNSIHASSPAASQHSDRSFDAEEGETVTFVTWDHELFKASSPPVDPMGDDGLFQIAIMDPIAEEPMKPIIELSPRRSSGAVRKASLPASTKSTSAKLRKARQPMNSDWANCDKPLPTVDDTTSSSRSSARFSTQLFEGIKSVVTRSPTLKK